MAIKSWIQYLAKIHGVSVSWLAPCLAKLMGHP